MNRRGLSTEAMLILSVFFVFVVVVSAVLVSSMYNPPKSTSHQEGICAMRGIDLENYNRLAKNASDAARSIDVYFREKKVSPCDVNTRLEFTETTCTIGEYDNVLVSVNEKHCSLQDRNITKPD